MYRHSSVIDPNPHNIYLYLQKSYRYNIIRVKDATSVLNGYEKYQISIINKIKEEKEKRHINEWAAGKDQILPYHCGYKAMALFPIQGHPRPYNEYKPMAL